MNTVVASVIALD
ncbi:hypothetical protein PENNAL_c0368G03262 [Penicillium nalgiovense]|uniref:Uncharacterized protein n=1 Tax=Penicillium nalgiovense TaxID=60175 RepID=A0A1V6W6Z2_PENNA|nr:hypothetical protein PENNAL_c0368G03262 [Penicillium nalgiovense]